MPLTILYPSDVAHAVDLHGGADGTEYKAGGTDVVDRHHQGILAPRTLVDLGRLGVLRGVEQRGDGWRIGALTTLLEVAGHEGLGREHPVLRQACDRTATPQVRAMATLGGSLRQKVRCPYFRHPDFTCWRKGGQECFARPGDNHWHAIWDNDTCAAVHPSTPAAALLALDAQLDVHFPGGDQRTVDMRAFTTFDVSDAMADDALPDAALVLGVRIPRPARPTRQAYERASARHLADWADVETAVVLQMDGDVVADARVVLGAVARRPRRAVEVEQRLNGHRLDAAVIADASAHAADGATPLPHNGHKTRLACNTVQATLERLTS
ncbi:MAG: FAD binding domain-containing protein [Deltaproteobacteria bacterium]|nr:FAD binding domain-containing protein [Deltaproteobacteria bacterium]